MGEGQAIAEAIATSSGSLSAVPRNHYKPQARWARCIIMNCKHCRVLVLSLSMILAPIVHGADEHDPFPVRSPEDLSPPIVGDPIHECARAVHVSGFRPGATVRVYANGVEEVGRTTPFLGFDDIPLRPPLNLGERITATQSVGSVVSLQSYDPVIVRRFPVKLTKPVVGPDLFGCGRIVPV